MVQLERLVQGQAVMTAPLSAPRRCNRLPGNETGCIGSSGPEANMIRKKRIFYFAWTPPSENGGACLAMRRHLIEHNDFDLFVATSGKFEHPSVPNLRVKRHPALLRLSNTRLSR